MMGNCGNMTDEEIRAEDPIGREATHFQDRGG